MLDFSDLKIDVAATLGRQMYLIGIVPVIEYRPAAWAEVVAHRYIVTLPALGCKSIGIQIPGPQLIDPPDPGTLTKVTFENLKINAFQEITGTIKVEITATKIKKVDFEHHA